jgi:ankyrin repeat protein
MRNRIVAVVAAGVMAACATAGGAQTQTPPAEAIEITIERTPCFGMCPEYKVTMKDEGTVTYTGRQYVRVTGERTWKIDPAAVRALAREMEAAGYFDLQDEYTSRMTDHPTTRTSLTIGTRSKKISDYISGPQTLKDIEQRIDDVSGAKKFVFIDGKTIREMQKTGWRAARGDADEWMRRAINAADVDVVAALLSAGYNAKAVDGDKVTLVMRAAETGHAGTVRLLLAAGADPTARDKAGRNAADRARDGLASGPAGEFDLILKLLTDE